jgi:hypothetical protein
LLSDPSVDFQKKNS